MNISGIVGEIIGMIIGLYIANAIPSWHISFITDAYLRYLPYSNAAIVSTGILKILMHIFPWYPLQRVFEGLAELVAIISLYLLLTIFPFNFAAINHPELNTIFYWIFILAIFGTSVAFITSVVRLCKGKSS